MIDGQGGCSNGGSGSATEKTYDPIVLDTGVGRVYLNNATDTLNLPGGRFVDVE